MPFLCSYAGHICGSMENPFADEGDCFSTGGKGLGARHRSTVRYIYIPLTKIVMRPALD